MRVSREFIGALKTARKPAYVLASEVGLSPSLIAHYKDENRQLPSASEIGRLIEKGGWNTEEELMAWVGLEVITRLEAVRDAVMAYHNLKKLEE